MISDMSAVSLRYATAIPVGRPDDGFTISIHKLKSLLTSTSGWDQHIAATPRRPFFMTYMIAMQSKILSQKMSDIR